MSAPPTLRTARLLLRRPVLDDAPTIMQRFAADPEVTRYLSWPLHRSVEDSRAFVHWSDQTWSSSPAGPT